jgi:hypothetical protein
MWVKGFSIRKNNGIMELDESLTSARIAMKCHQHHSYIVTFEGIVYFLNRIGMPWYNLKTEELKGFYR